MTLYYNWKQTPALEFKAGDMVFLDASNIQTTRPSHKLSHQRLGPFPIDSQIGNGAFRLCLPPSMSRLHPVFNVVKLSLAPLDPIPGRRTSPPPLPEIVNGEEEWVVEEILDSRMVKWKLRYLVKWEGFGVEHNSWEPWDNVRAPQLVVDFYQRHPGAARHIHMVNFCSIPFHSVSGRHCLEGGWILGDAPLRPMFPPIFLCHLCIFLLIVASPRRSALIAPIPESDGHVM